MPAASSRYRGLGSFVFALLGLAVSVYLTIEHFSTAITFACPETATINCQKVTTSHWSHLGPIPLALLGLAYFVAMSVLCCPPAWRVRKLERVRVTAAGLGVLTALVLVWIELFRVDAICLWCTSVHVITFALFAVVALTEAWIGPPGAAVPLG